MTTGQIIFVVVMAYAVISTGVAALLSPPGWREAGAARWALVGILAARRDLGSGYGVLVDLGHAGVGEMTPLLTIQQSIVDRIKSRPIGSASRFALMDAADAVSRTIEAEGREAVVKPLGAFCDACQAIPAHGYCNLAGCPMSAAKPKERAA